MKGTEHKIKAFDKSTLEFWRSELEYLREGCDEESGLMWADRFERLLHEVNKLYNGPYEYTQKLSEKT